jgi:hypothetical protein
MNILVYQLDGSYSFSVDNGGEPVKLALADGYATLTLLNGTKMIVGERLAVSIEEAIHHGFAEIVGVVQASLRAPDIARPQDES